MRRSLFTITIVLNLFFCFGVFIATPAYSMTATQEVTGGGGGSSGDGGGTATGVTTPPVTPPRETPPPETPPEVVPPEVPPEVVPEVPPEIPPEVIPEVIPEVVPTLPEAEVPSILTPFVNFGQSVSGAVSGVVQGIINSFSGPVGQAIGNAAVKISEFSVAATEETRKFVQSPVGQVTTRIAEPIGVVSGVAIITTQAIMSSAAMTVSSFSDIYLLAWRLLGVIFGARKRKGKPWGTVYDSMTKRPLDPAYVIVAKETGEEVADAITDLDGRYGFLIPEGTYNLKASKTNYTFPTKVLENRTNDEIYDNIYHGESVTTKPGDVILKNIPLDPIGFDWNEFEKNKQNLFRIYSDRERFWKKFFDAFYLVGLLSAVIATVFDPKTINYIFLAIYAIFILHSMFGGEKKKAVSVKYAATQEPIPFAVIKIFFAELKNQVKTVVADHLGRFFFLVGPGNYYFTVDIKQPDGSYKRIHESKPMELKQGVITQDILV